MHVEYFELNEGQNIYKNKMKLIQEIEIYGRESFLSLLTEKLKKNPTL